MTLPQPVRDQMELFVAKAAKLEASAYMEHVRQRGGTRYTFDWSRETREARIESNVPPDEARDALLLTARMLMQERDNVSFWSMAKLASESEVSQEWKDHAVGIRDHVTAYLKQQINATLFGHTPTNEEIFFTFLYGEYAHTSKKYMKTYNFWKQQDSFFIYLEWWFHGIVIFILRMATALRVLTQMELEGKEVPPLEEPATIEEEPVDGLHWTLSEPTK